MVRIAGTTFKMVPSNQKVTVKSDRYGSLITDFFIHK